MSFQYSKTMMICAAGFVLAGAGTGCATKKYVNRQISPVEQRVGGVEKKTTEQASALEGLNTDISKTRERVGDLDAGLQKTTQAAAEANAAAQQANSAAQQAGQSAKDARAYAEQRGNTLEQFIEARDRFKLARTEQILFRSGSAVLTNEAKAALDAIAKDSSGKARLILEIQGFTDNTGPAHTNIALSQRRAEAVVRYLTTIHNIPLRSIHLIGSGEEAPMADNKTRQGRKQNRRVEVRMFAPEVENSSALTSAQLR